MKIGIVIGSHRPGSQSAKVGKAVEQHLEAMTECGSVYVLDIGGNSLPLWDEGMWSNDPDWQALFGPISDALASCDGFVVVSPEWSGMSPAGLKNLFLLCGNGELSHKPAYLIGVSASEGGAYPIAELRMSSYKNTRLCYIPEHLIVRRVEKVFNAEADSNDPRSHKYLSERLDFGLKNLCAYAAALGAMRRETVLDDSRFPHGM